jgi:hypothetical protein
MHSVALRHETALSWLEVAPRKFGVGMTVQRPAAQRSASVNVPRRLEAYCPTATHRPPFAHDTPFS